MGIRESLSTAWPHVKLFTVYLVCLLVMVLPAALFPIAMGPLIGSLVGLAATIVWANFICVPLFSHIFEQGYIDLSKGM